MFLQFIDAPQCTIMKLMGLARIASSDKEQIEYFEVDSFEECSNSCLENGECKSFAYASHYVKTCNLKYQTITAKSAIRSENTNYFSAFKVCGKGMKDD